jgi:hypothetical protein
MMAQRSGRPVRAKCRWCRMPSVHCTTRPTTTRMPMIWCADLKGLVCGG